LTRSKFVLRDAGRNVYRHPTVALGSLLALALIFLLFDIFWVAALSTNRFYSNLLSQIRVEVFLRESVADTSVAAISSNIAAIPGVDSIRFISKNEARQELARLVGIDLLAGYDTLNPLPRSFVLAVNSSALSVSEMQRIEQSLAALDEVEDVLYSRQWLAKAESTRSIVSNVGLVIGTLILLTAVTSSANSIRLMTRARGAGFHQMLLLGAGRIFIASPFLLEGVLLTGLSAGIGWLVIWYFHGKVVFTQFPLVLPEGGQVAMFIVSAALLGGISGYFGIRKLLR
jgi:cell division transport system permease protein